MALYPLVILIYYLISSSAPPGPSFKRNEIDGQIRIGYGLAIGDVDGDGRSDIILADQDEFAWYRNPDWKRYTMTHHLTERDNVCLAARDIDGDGKVEVAVGAQWNPGETKNETESGAVYFLVRPKDPQGAWRPVKLHHEPTVHRMHWIRTGDTFQLVVLPLHGRGNMNGEGQGVRIFAYKVPENPDSVWKVDLLDETMHLAHNFEVIDMDGSEALLIGGKEGAKLIRYASGRWQASEWLITDYGFGEIRKGNNFIAGIQPMHGNSLVLYPDAGGRIVLTDQLDQGHALAVDQFFHPVGDQIVAGWRETNNANEFGIRIFWREIDTGTVWSSAWIDRNGMACEDLKVADLNKDGKKDIIASGRSTHNLVIYWNQSVR